MADLKYYWIARYSDNSLFPQFSDNGIENLFGNIDLSQLKSFHLVNKDTFEEVAFVDLNAGVIGLEKTQILFNDYEPNRLVYYRRMRHDSIGMIGENGIITCKHVIGLQTTVNNTNKKLLFSINDDNGMIAYIG